MTDKATVEMTASVSGGILRLESEIGEQVAIGSILAKFETDDADALEAPAVTEPEAAITEPVTGPAPTSVEENKMLVIRHAESRNIWQLASEIARLADAARTGKAKSDERSGSTFTITSLGPLGGVATTPVINRPEVAIIGPKVMERPIFRDVPLRIERETPTCSLWPCAALPVGVLSAPVTGAAAPRPDDNPMRPRLP